MSAEHAYRHERGQMYGGHHYGQQAMVRQVETGNPYEPWESPMMIYEGQLPCQRCGGQGCPTCQAHLFGSVSSHHHQSGASCHPIPGPTNYTQAPNQPTNHEFDRVLLNPPIAACNGKPSTPAVPMNACHSMMASSSCSKGCDNAQFVLESAPKHC